MFDDEGAHSDEPKTIKQRDYKDTEKQNGGSNYDELKTSQSKIPVRGSLQEHQTRNRCRLRKTFTTCTNVNTDSGETQ